MRGGRVSNVDCGEGGMVKERIGVSVYGRIGVFARRCPASRSRTGL